LGASKFLLGIAWPLAFMGIKPLGEYPAKTKCRQAYYQAPRDHHKYPATYLHKVLSLRSAVGHCENNAYHTNTNIAPRAQNTNFMIPLFARHCLL